MVSLVPATAENWREISRVRATKGQRNWVADVTYYLCLSTFEGLWQSCGIVDDGATVGHVMWAVDPEDDSHWIGGLVIDRKSQGKGLGRSTVQALLALWEDQEPALSGTPYTQAALSVAPDNETARALYLSMGFAETGEMSDDELVMRRPRAHQE
jgi:diamine N-acetyltransferase